MLGTFSWRCSESFPLKEFVHLVRCRAFKATVVAFMSREHRELGGWARLQAILACPVGGTTFGVELTGAQRSNFSSVGRVRQPLSDFEFQGGPLLAVFERWDSCHFQ